MNTGKDKNTLIPKTDPKANSGKVFRNQQKRWMMTLIIAGVLVICLLFITTRSGTTDAAGEQTVGVRRGDLIVTVTESGSIRAKDSIQYKNRVERRRGSADVTILSIVPPGTYVTQEDVDNGMVLVELDSSSLKDQLQEEEMELAGDQEALTAAKEAYDIQVIQNESDVAAARLKVRFALMDLEKYLGKPLAQQLTENVTEADDLSQHVAPFLEQVMSDPNLLEGSSAGQELKSLRDEIVLAEGNLKTAMDTLAGSVKLHEADYVSDLELERDRLNVTNRQFAQQNTQVNMDLFLKYDFPKNAEQNLSDYIEAGRELERTYAECRSRLAQAQAKLNNAQERFRSQSNYVNELKQQIEYCTIRAIAPGLVIYGEGGSGDRFRAFRGSGGIIAEGEVVYEGQTIISMPDTAAMVAEVSVHETEVDKVRPGQPVQVIMDAFPDKILHGRVLEVAPLPDQQRGWMNPDLKVYKTLVSIDGTHDFLKTRMSCKVEILVRRLEDVLLVPIQVVSNRGGRKVCYVANGSSPEEREVSTGAFTDTWVQITSGLEEGEEILLNPPMFEELSGQPAFERAQNWDDGNTASQSVAASTETSADADTATSKEQQASRQDKAASNPMAAQFKQMDTNGDGKISLSDEVPEQAKEFIKRLDTNSDGFIDNDEIDKAAKQFGAGRGGPQGAQRPRREAAVTGSNSSGASRAGQRQPSQQ